MLENLIKTSLPEISLIPHNLFSVYNIQINPAHLSSFAVTLIIFALGLILKNNLSYVPGRFQLIFEEIVGFFYNSSKISFGDEKSAKRYISFILSLFIFIGIENQFTLIPFIQSILINEKDAFMPSTAHLSQTLTLALIVVLLSHIAALIKSPMNHIFNLLNLHEILNVKSLKDIPNMFLQIFLGILNLIGEFTKVISLSVRLFGNIFAGEVMVAVITGISIYSMFLVPIPFMILGIFSGIIQAFVFSFLAIAFVSDTIKK
jgi:F-type H+-transporting ATPase subunit a